MHLCVLRSITHESWTIMTKPPRKDLGHTNTKCHNMITSLTNSDLRNTLCGRLKLQETQKMKMTLSHTVWPIIAVLQNTKFLLRKRYNRRTFASFAIFADISGPFLASSLSKSCLLLDLLFLPYLQNLLRVFSASKKNPCYSCDFCDICGHFGVLRGFFFF